MEPPTGGTILTAPSTGTSWEAEEPSPSPTSTWLRGLKRRLSDIVFTTMRHDAAGADASPDQASPPAWPLLVGVGAVDANEARLTA